MKYEPKVDYRRKRGLVEEINRAIQSVEEDAEALGNAGKRQYVPEGPIDEGPSHIDAPPDDAGHGNGESRSH